MAVFEIQQAGGKIVVEYTVTQDVTGNRSTLSAAAYLVRTSSAYTGWNADGVPFTLTVAGNAKTISWAYDLRPLTVGARYYIMSHTVSVAHDSAGNHAPVSITVYCASGSASLGTISGSQTVTLPVLPRSASIRLNLEHQYLGQDVTITVNRKLSSYKHRVGVQLDGDIILWTDIPAGVGDVSKTITLPLDWGTHITTAENRWVNFFVNTNTANGAYIGTQFTRLLLMIPGVMLPEISYFQGADVGGIGGMITEGLSKVKLTVRATAKYGATLKRARFTMGNVAGESTSFTNEGQSEIILNLPNNLIFTGDSAPLHAECTVTDSRGKSVKWVRDMTVYRYQVPIISKLEHQRVNESGAHSETGTRIKIFYTVAFSAVGGVNTKTVRIRLGAPDAADAPIVHTIGASGPFDGSVIVEASSSAHRIIIEAVDSKTTVSRTRHVPSATFLWDACATGMAFGTEAEPGVLILGSATMPIKIEEKVYPTILSGYSNVSGFAETSYQKDPFGWIHVSIDVQKDDTSRGMQTIFTLPQYYRPKKVQEYAVQALTSTNGVMAPFPLQVEPGGAVKLWKETDRKRFIAHFQFLREQ